MNDGVQDECEGLSDSCVWVVVKSIVNKNGVNV